MAWSKMKQSLESFLSPALSGRVEYCATSYRYLPDKAGRCYIKVDKNNIFNMSDTSTLIRWYQTEQEIKNDPDIQIPISSEEIERVGKKRLLNMAEKMKLKHPIVQCFYELRLSTIDTV
ncbi:MAG: hypothetical protein Q8936_22770, partial [Bacillota bacterium]|nr:hypothetical protein [Bacillota bacterium]